MNYETETLDPDSDDGRMPENVAELANAVVGHRIVSVEKGVQVPKRAQDWRASTGTALTLDNGRHVFLIDTDDCCAYTELETFLTYPERIDHVITGVGTTGEFTRWHIYADMGDVLELSVSWSAGNPFYYGYGFDIRVVDGD